MNNGSAEKQTVKSDEDLTEQGSGKSAIAAEKISSAVGKAPAVLYRGLNKAVTTPQILFLIIASVLGFTLAFVNPMFHVADEPVHFMKAYSVSEFHLASENRNGVVGNWLPLSIPKTVEAVEFKVPAVKIDKKAVDSGFRVPLKSNQKGFLSNGLARYPPVPYIPQAVGIGIGRIFNESPLTLAYIGRVFNLLAWLILVFLAISVTPVLKWVFFLLGVMPMAVLQAASLSGDSVTNGLAFLTIAFFLKLAFAKDKQGVTNGDLALLFILGMLLAFMKAPYFLLVFLFLLIPRSKFRTNKEYYFVFAALALIVLVIVFSWTIMESTSAYTPTRPDVIAEGQVSFILQHPYATAVIMYRSINLYKQDWLLQFVGMLDWFETALPLWVAYLFLFFLIGTAVLDKDKDVTIRNRYKLLMFVIAMLMFLGILVILLLSWTPAGHLIQGAQGRYWIPLAPLLLLLFYNQAVSYEKGKMFYALMVAVPVLTSVMTVLRIWNRFY